MLSGFIPMTKIIRWKDYYMRKNNQLNYIIVQFKVFQKVQFGYLKTLYNMQILLFTVILIIVDLLNLDCICYSGAASMT